MSERRLFGTDGVRGRAHDELTTEFAARLARAASRVLGSSFDDRVRVVLGADALLGETLGPVGYIGGALIGSAVLLVIQDDPSDDLTNTQ